MCSDAKGAERPVHSTADELQGAELGVQRCKGSASVTVGRGKGESARCDECVACELRVSLQAEELPQWLADGAGRFISRWHARRPWVC